MCSTVIRAYRVKSVSSHCESVPMWTSNYCDGISAFSGWKAFNCSSVFFEEGKWIDETWRTCEITPLLRKKKAVVSFHQSHFCAFVYSLLPKLFSPAPAALNNEEIKSQEVTAVLSARSDLSTMDAVAVWNPAAAARCLVLLSSQDLLCDCGFMSRLSCSTSSPPSSPSPLFLPGRGASRRGVSCRMSNVIRHKRAEVRKNPAKDKQKR